MVDSVLSWELAGTHSVWHECKNTGVYGRYVWVCGEVCVGVWGGMCGCGERKDFN